MIKQSVLLFGWLLLVIPTAVQAQFNYTVTTNQTVTITGYTGTNSVVSIPNTINALPVTSVGFQAFYYSSITSVTIPNSVTNIGNWAFAFSSLTNVTIPNSVTTIGTNAFSYCAALTNVTIPVSVFEIGEAAFEQSALVSVTIPNSVTSIAGGAFVGCLSLTNVVIPNSVTSIGDDAFGNCRSLTTVTIPNSVTNIESSAFFYCLGLTGVYFEGNAPSVAGYNVFDGDIHTVCYYLPGTTGWGTSLGGRPTAVWTLPYPVILTSTTSFGVQTNQFAFTVSWATNLNVVVEAATDLGNAAWTPVTTDALNGGTFYFTDPLWTNYSSRFYRIRSQ